MVCTIRETSSVEYYIKLADARGDVAQLRKALGYYTNEVEAGREPPGRWYCSGDDLEQLFDIKPGSVVVPEELREIYAGKFPNSGHQFITANEKTIGAFDLTFAAPKAVSILGALHPDAAVRKHINDIHERAVKAALDAVVSKYAQTRIKEGGVKRNEKVQVIAALFTQEDARGVEDDNDNVMPGDCHKHTHCVTMNFGLNTDGEFRRLDGRLVYDIQLEAGRIHEAETARLLQVELGCIITNEHVATKRNKPGFDIEGIPDDLKKLFSKRREKIKEVSADANAAAQAVAQRETRAEKSDEKHDRYLTWRQQAIDHLGIDIDKLDDIMREAVGHQQPQQMSEPDWSEFAKDVLSMESFLRRSQVEAMVAGAMIARGYTVEEIQTISRRVLDEHFQVCGIDDKEITTLHTTDRVIAQEAEVRELATEAASKSRHKVADNVLQKHINANATLTEEQKDMLRVACQTSDLCIAQGAAGSGKSFTLGVAASAHREMGKQIIGGSTSWEATDELRDSIGGDCRALAAWIARWEKGKDIPTANTVFVLDEAAMTDRESMLAVLRMQQRTGMKVICAGDEQQLKPVGSGNPINLVADMLPDESKMRIRGTQRQKQQEDRDAATALSDGDPTVMISRAKSIGAWHAIEGEEATLQKAIELHQQYRAQNIDVAVLAATNAEVQDLSQRIRAQLIEQGKVEAIGQVIEARNKIGDTFDMELAKGDIIRFQQKHEALKGVVRNGTRGLVTHVDANGMHFRPIDRKGNIGEEVSVAWDDLREDDGAIPIGLAYAMTVHNSQGMTIDQTIGVFSKGTDVANKNLAYVIGSRHRHRFDMIINVEAVRDKLAMKLKIGKRDIDTITPSMIEDAIVGDLKKKQLKPNAFERLKKAGVSIENINSKMGTYKDIITPQLEAAIKGLVTLNAERRLQPVAQAMQPLKKALDQAAQQMKQLRDNFSEIKRVIPRMKAGIDKLNQAVDRMVERRRQQAPIKLSNMPREVFEQHRQKMLQHLDMYIVGRDPNEYLQARAAYAQIGKDGQFAAMPERDAVSRMLANEKPVIDVQEPPLYRDLGHVIQAARSGREARVDRDVRDMLARTLDMISYRARPEPEQKKLELNLRFNILNLRNLGYDIREEVAAKRPSLLPVVEDIAKRQGVSLLPARTNRQREQDNEIMR